MISKIVLMMCYNDAQGINKVHFGTSFAM